VPSLAVKTEGLCRRFGDHVAVDGIDLEVAEGAIYGFLGSNGAGKSTTVRMLLGLRRPDAGAISLFGRQISGPNDPQRPLIGAMADSPGGAFYDHLSARDNLRVQALALGLDDDVDRLLEMVGLAGKESQKVGGFSTGMRQRLGIARALIGNPALVILDEPLNGLDPEGIRAMRVLLKDLAAGRTMIICSHLLDEVEKVATHIGLLSRGRLIHQGSMKELRASAGTVRIEAKGADLGGLFERMGISANPVRDGRWSVHLAPGQEIAALNKQLVDAGVAVSALIPQPFSLEEFYHDHVRSA